MKRFSFINFSYNDEKRGYEISGYIDYMELSAAFNEMDELEKSVMRHGMASGGDMTQNLDILFRTFKRMDKEPTDA